MVQGLLPQEYPFQAALGIVPGHQQGSRVAQLDNIGTAAFVVFSNNQPYIPPAAPQQMQVISSSANDDGSPAGTGAHQVEITYLTISTNSQEPFKKKTEIVTLNGLAAVNTVNTDIYRIDRFRVSKVGAGQSAAGNILLQSVGGATTFERIDAGTNVFRSLIHWIPKGFGCVVTDYEVGVTTTGGVIFILEEIEVDPSGNAVAVGQNQVEFANGSHSHIFVSPHATLNPNGRELAFFITVKGRAANQQASGSFNFIDFPL
jgi:hypothetical protein